jgi:hypothetical protein
MNLYNIKTTMRRMGMALLSKIYYTTTRKDNPHSSSSTTTTTTTSFCFYLHMG